MPLLDHLAELRRRLTAIVISVVVTALVVYMASPTLIELLIDPVREFLPNGGQLSVLSALGGFTIRFKVAVFFSVIICSPIIIFEVLGFFLPALRPSEQRWVAPTVAALVFLFFLGMVSCYFVVLNAAFGWMLGQTSDFAQVLPNAEDYLNLIMNLEIGFGLAFELPLLVFYLTILHVVPYKVFREQWRMIYVVGLVLCAMITPDASPVTMFFMFAILIGLYEVSLAIARRVIVARDGKAALKWSRDEYSEHKLDKELEEND